MTDDMARLIERLEATAREYDRWNSPEYNTTSGVLREAASALSKAVEERDNARIAGDSNTRAAIARAERTEEAAKGAEYNEGLMRAELRQAEEERDMLRDVAAWRGTMLARYHDVSCSVFSDLPTERALNEGLGVGNDCNCGDQDALLRGNADLRAERDALTGDAASWKDTAEAYRLRAERAEAALDDALRATSACQRCGGSKVDPDYRGIYLTTLGRCQGCEGSGQKPTATSEGK